MSEPAPPDGAPTSTSERVSSSTRPPLGYITEEHLVWMDDGKVAWAEALESEADSETVSEGHPPLPRLPAGHPTSAYGRQPVRVDYVQYPVDVHPDHQSDADVVTAIAIADRPPVCPAEADPLASIQNCSATIHLAYPFPRQTSRLYTNAHNG